MPALSLCFMEDTICFSKLIFNLGHYNVEPSAQTT